MEEKLEEERKKKFLSNAADHAEMIVAIFALSTPDEWTEATIPKTVTIRLPYLVDLALRRIAAKTGTAKYFDEIFVASLTSLMALGLSVYMRSPNGMKRIIELQSLLFQVVGGGKNGTV